MLLDIILASIAVLIVFTSAAKIQSKVDILEKLELHGKSLEAHFESKTIDKPSRQLSANKFITLFFVIAVLSFVCLMLNAFIYTPISLSFYFQYQIFSVTINVQCFQIFLYSEMVRSELKVLGMVDVNKLGANELQIFKRMIVQTHGMIDDVIKVFDFPMLLVTMWNFFAVLTNLNWIAEYFLGNPNASVTGELNQFF